MSIPTKSKTITARVTPAEHREFRRAVKGYGRASDVLRQLVRQFIRENLEVKSSK